jgi:hypothetical protein
MRAGIGCGVFGLLGMGLLGAGQELGMRLYALILQAGEVVVLAGLVVVVVVVEVVVVVVEVVEVVEVVVWEFLEVLE